jgi:hypothetical protein
MYAQNLETCWRIRRAVWLQCDTTCRRLTDSALMGYNVSPNGTHCAVFRSAAKEMRLIFCTAILTSPTCSVCSPSRVQPHKQPRSIPWYSIWQISRFTRAICRNGLSRTLHKNPRESTDGGERKFVWRVVCYRTPWTRLNVSKVATKSSWNVTS